MRILSKILAATGLLVAASTVTLAGEGRIPVYAPGTVISSSGRYVLTRNLDGTGATVIQINNVWNVDLDLNGFYIDGAGAPAIQILNAGEVRIHGGVIQNSSVGIDFTQTIVRAVLEDLRIASPLSHGIRLQANDIAVRRVMVNQAGGDGIQISAVTPATGRVESCLVFGGAGRGIYVYGGSSLVLTDNVIRAPQAEGIYLDGCDGCLLKDNTVTQARGQGGIYVNFAQGSTLRGNVVSLNENHGIHVGQFGRDITVENNLMKSNGSVATPGDGLRFAGYGGTIVGNTMNSNMGIGLQHCAAELGAGR
jgi:parallel beta-helix repeat protein